MLLMRVAVISRSISQNYVKTDLKAAAGLQAIRGFCFHSVVRKQEKQASKQAVSRKALQYFKLAVLLSPPFPTHSPFLYFRPLVAISQQTSKLCQNPHGVQGEQLKVSFRM
jgi:hypothetical protein